jgi:hypothetical protein
MSPKFVSVGVVVCGAVLLSSCSDSLGPYQCSPGITAGAPVIQIASVKKANGESVVTFYLSNFRKESQELSAAEVVQNVPGTNATVVGNSLKCTGSCGFGNGHGEYSFTVSASGLDPVTVAVSADYGRIDLSQCPQILVDGTVVNVVMK